MFILQKQSIIWPVIRTTYKIIGSKINNFNTCKILKNRFKKNKNSSNNATLIYLLFDLLVLMKIAEKIKEMIKAPIGLAVECI